MMNERFSRWTAALIAACVILSSRPADAQSPLQRVLDLNRQGMDAYMNLEVEQAQQHLQQALQAAQQNGITGAPLARTYLNLGVLAVGGFGDNSTGMRHFVSALEADPNIEPDPLTSTPEIQTVFQLAQRRASSGGGAAGGDAGGGGDAPPQEVGGNIPHQPVPEQLVSTAVPVYIEVSGDPANVYLFYKAHGMREFRRVEMQPMAGGYGFEIPCSDVFQPTLEYYIVAFGSDGSPLGFAGSQNDPVTVDIVSSRSHPAPALPGRAPPAQCTDEECPPGMDGCAAGGGGGMGATCITSDECGSGLTCEDNFCVAGAGGGGGGGGGASSDQPNFFIHVGGSLGLGWASQGVQADRFPGADTRGYVLGGQPGCDLDTELPPDQRRYCVQVATEGFVPHPGIRVAAGYYFLPFLGAAVWARFNPMPGEGDFAFATIGARLELQVTEPVESGFHASVFAGGGGGRVQIQPPGNGDDAPYLISGYGNISLGGYAGYRFMRNFGVVAEVDLMFMVPSFLFNLDITVNAAVTF